MRSDKLLIGCGGAIAVLTGCAGLIMLVLKLMDAVW